MGEDTGHHLLRITIAPRDRNLLRDLLDGLFDTLTAEEFSSDPAREIGIRLVAEHFTGDHSVSRTVEVLGQALLTHPELQEIADLPRKVVTLLGATGGGFLRRGVPNTITLTPTPTPTPARRTVTESVYKDTGWVPDDVDVEIPSSARIYDYVLGGGHNFKADRMAAERLLSAIPADEMARRNRGFLRRAVMFMLNNGIRQFLDLGSGIPTVGNVHEVVQRAEPSCRVLYVDLDAIAVAHSELLLAENDSTEAIQADLRLPGVILATPDAHRLLNLNEPLGLLMVGVMQFIPDSDDPWGIVAAYRDRLAPGSYLALSHFTSDSMPDEMAQAVEVFKTTREPAHPRSYQQVLRMLDGFEVVEPGLVATSQWRPECPADAEQAPQHSNLYAVVGRKP